MNNLMELRIGWPKKSKTKRVWIEIVFKRSCGGGGVDISFTKQTMNL